MSLKEQINLLVGQKQIKFEVTFCEKNKELETSLNRMFRQQSRFCVDGDCVIEYMIALKDVGFVVELCINNADCKSLKVEKV